ncbi:hypothetical protein [Streptomyces spongiae]|nr:hypothetical protein [Streptomyces spongiae]
MTGHLSTDGGDGPGTVEHPTVTRQSVDYDVPSTPVRDPGP